MASPDFAAPPLAGVLPVFQTPFHDDESIDFDTLAREFDWLFDEGASGVVMAMVSETLRLSSEERDALAAATCRMAAGRGAAVVSVGAESSHSAIRYARHAEDCGATAVMAIPPVATALGEQELRGYYERILAAISIPVIVQDASGYVGRPMSIELQARLFHEHGPRVMFKPEGVPLGPRLSQLREAVGPDARIFEGSGGIALVESHARGVNGTMPGAELIDVLVALWRALEAGDSATIDRLSLPLAAIVSLQTSLDAFLAVEKYLLVKRGIFKNSFVRGPRGYALDEFTRREVNRLLDLLLASTR